MNQETTGFCPNCNIGLNNSEERLRFCQNCKHSWEPTDVIAEPQQSDSQKVIQECDECGQACFVTFAGVCEECATKFQ